MSDAASLVHKKITLDDMWQVCADIAFEIECSNAAWQKLQGIPPDPKRQHRAETLNNVCRFIDVVREVESEFRALVARKRGWTKGRGQ